MTRYALRPRARRDIEEIWDCSVAAWGVRQAENYVRQVQRSLEILANYPRLGRACDDIRPGYRKHPTGSHVVFYRIDEDGIEVVRILHQRMDFEPRL